MRFNLVPGLILAVLSLPAFAQFPPTLPGGETPPAGESMIPKGAAEECATIDCFFNKAKAAYPDAASCDSGLATASNCCNAKGKLGDECYKKIFTEGRGGKLGGRVSDLLPPETEGGGGAHGATVDTKRSYKLGSVESYRYGGVCKRMAEICSKACGSDAAKMPKCKEIEEKSKIAAGDGDRYKEGAGKTDPGSSASNPGGPGGAPTQQPQSAGGKNPMQDIMKALQGAMQQQGQKPPQEPFQSQTCEQNPSLAGCPVKKPEDDSWNKKQAESEFREQSTGGNGDNFNVGDAGDGIKTASFNGNGEDRPTGTPGTSSGVPNGGGGIPGGGGGGGAAASGGSASGGGPAAKNLTDVLHGAGGGGGYSAMNANMQMQNGGGGGFSGYGGGGPGEFKPGMDLRQFLPGGKADPTRKLAGGASSFQIQPQTVNIWNRISERIRARCTQGLLRDCGP